MTKITQGGGMGPAWLEKLEKASGRSLNVEDRSASESTISASAPAQQVIPCTSCGQKIRVPTNRGSLKVRCPSCRNEFPWSPPESQQVSFCCAESGAEFVVLFARENAAKKFRIRSIQPVGLQTAERASPRSGSFEHTPVAKALNATEFDVSGWECPHCKHGKSSVTTLFVKCGTCNKLVCGSKVITVENGSKSTFQCTPTCGGSGVLTGEIDAYDAERIRPEEPKRESATKREPQLTKRADVKSLQKPG